MANSRRSVNPRTNNNCCTGTHIHPERAEMLDGGFIKNCEIGLVVSNN